MFILIENSNKFQTKKFKCLKLKKKIKILVPFLFLEIKLTKFFIIFKF